MAQLQVDPNVVANIWQNKFNEVNTTNVLLEAALSQVQQDLEAAQKQIAEMTAAQQHEVEAPEQVQG